MADPALVWKGREIRTGDIATGRNRWNQYVHITVRSWTVERGEPILLGLDRNGNSRVLRHADVTRVEPGPPPRPKRRRRIDPEQARRADGEPRKSTKGPVPR